MPVQDSLRAEELGFITPTETKNKSTVVFVHSLHPLVVVECDVNRMRCHLEFCDGGWPCHGLLWADKRGNALFDANSFWLRGGTQLIPLDRDHLFGVSKVPIPIERSPPLLSSHPPSPCKQSTAHAYAPYSNMRVPARISLHTASCGARSVVRTPSLDTMERISSYYDAGQLGHSCMCRSRSLSTATCRRSRRLRAVVSSDL